jgi:ribokinase
VNAAAETLRSVDTIILQFEIPLETVYYAVQFARRNNIRCIVNPAPALPAQLGELAGADYFVPNETEAEAIAGLPVRSIDDAKKCAAALLQKGFSKVILTLGARGSLLASAEGDALIAPFEVTAKDTTGAGDAFIGSFSVFLAEGLPEAEALSRANLYAALSTLRVGTQKSFPTRGEFEDEWKRRSERKRDSSLRSE